MAMMAHGVGRTDWGDEGKKAKVSWRSLKRMVGYFTPYKGLVTFMFISVLFSSGLLLLPPLFTKFLVDEVLLAGGSLNLLFWLVAGWRVEADGQHLGARIRPLRELEQLEGRRRRRIGLARAAAE